MASSDFQLNYETLAVEVSDFMGAGRTLANLSSDETSRLNAYIKAGLSRFYSAKRWSFMKASGTITTAADDYQYDLPDDFSGKFSSPPTLIASDSTYNFRIAVVSEAALQNKRRGFPAMTGKPLQCAIIPKTFVNSTGQRWEIKFWPIPDAEYSLEYSYQRVPDTINATGEIPMGSPLHQDVMLESCLAVVEQRLYHEVGTHTQMSAALLQQAMALDDSNAPESYGRLADTGKTFTDYPDPSYTITVDT